MQCITLWFSVIVRLVNAYWTNAKVEQKQKGRKQSHATRCSVPIQNPESNMPRYASLVLRHEDP